ncbi:hypothetical protein E1301_Tti021798 [Triplophysa tibetana]|uniref:BEN domain-containing protein n=1 Tax=Triplophysa tibetana TaxID=1572043 RepID=A0A5A9PF61_9TELE|nr:hypothetical protein E1301_Tti021798 [Triplophysa tibetana]
MELRAVGMEEKTVAGLKRRMSAEGTNTKLPRRARNPPKKMSLYEPDPSSPRDNQDGLFVFLTFEDGYTAKILNLCDILNKDDKPIACFRDLTPGEEVLARWSDNKFYKATVDFTGTADKTVDTKKATKKDMKKRDAAAQRFYNLPFLPQAGQSTSAQDHLNTVDQNVIQPPITWPVYQPPPTESFLPVQPQHQHATAWSQYQLPVSQSSPNTPQHYKLSPFQSLNQYRTTLSAIPHNSSLSQYSKHHQPHTALPTPSDQTQQQPVLADLDQRRQPQAPTAKESFLKMLHSPSGEHLEAFRSFLDKVEQIQPQAGVWAPKGRSRQQELYPGSGLFLSSTHLAAIHATAKKDCLRLFHLLFDEFFTAEECQNAVAFGKHGKVPDGKRVLDKFKVNAILTYVMRCSTLDGWTPVEKSKVKKAFINKCRIRATTL